MTLLKIEISDKSVGMIKTFSSQIENWV